MAISEQSGLFVASIQPKIDAKKVFNIAIYTDFNQNPVSTGPYLLQDLRTIQQSLDNLFHCHKYERRYEPMYYVPIWELIGELFELRGASAVLDRVKYYVEINEPRVKAYPEISQLDVNTSRTVAKLNLMIQVPTIRLGEMYSYQTTLENGET